MNTNNLECMPPPAFEVNMESFVSQNSSVPVHNAHIEQFKFLRVVCAWTYLKKSLNIFDITYLYPNTNNPEENRENSIFVNLTL